MNWWSEGAASVTDMPQSAPQCRASTLGRTAWLASECHHTKVILLFETNRIRTQYFTIINDTTSTNLVLYDFFAL